MMTGGVQQGQQELSRVQFGHPTHRGEQDVIFIEMPSSLVPPSSGGRQLLIQEIQPGNEPGGDIKGHSYITYDDFLRDLCDYTSIVGHPESVASQHGHNL